MACDILLSNNKPSKLYQDIRNIVKDDGIAIVEYAKALSIYDGLPKVNGEYSIEDVKLYLPELREPKNIKYSKDFMNSITVDAHINELLTKSKAIRKSKGEWVISKSKYHEGLKDVSFINKIYEDDTVTLAITPTQYRVKVNKTKVNKLQQEFDERQKYYPTQSIGEGSTRTLGNTAREVLDNISEGHPLYLLAQELKQSDFLDVPVTYTTSDNVNNVKTNVGLYLSETGGFYSSDTNEIVIIQDNINDRYLEKILLHEILHAASYNKIRTTKTGKEWNSFFNEIKQLLEDRGTLTFKNGKASVYAMNNADEMLTGVFTDSSFIKLLQSIPSTGKNYTNLWGKVLNFFKNLFGFKNTTLFDEVFALGTQLLAEPDVFSYTYSDDNYEYLPSMSNKQSITVDKLTKTSGTANEKVYDINGKKFVRTTKFNQNPIVAKIWNEPNLLFNEEFLFKKIESESKNQAEINEKKKKLKNKFKMASDIGTDAHKLFELIQDDSNTVEDYKEELKRKYDNQVVDDLEQIGLKIKDKIQEENSVILSEQVIKVEKDALKEEFLTKLEDYLKDSSITSGKEDLRNFMGIAGTADIFVVHDDGSVTIYDYKTSFKGFSEWSNSKMKGIRYQQGIYKNILESMGIRVRETVIIPIELDYNEDENKVTSVLSQSIDTIIVSLQGNEALNLSNMFKTNVNIELKDEERLSKVLEFERFFFNTTGGKKAKTRSVTNKDVDNYYQKLIDAGKTEVYLSYISKKVDLTNEKEAKIDITDNLLAMNFEKTQRVQVIQKYFERKAAVIASNSEDVVSMNIPGAERISQFFDYYLKDYSIDKNGNVSFDWEIVNNPALNAIDIVGLVNKSSGVIEFVSITEEEETEVVPNFTMLGKYMRKMQALDRGVDLLPTRTNIDMIKTLVYYLANQQFFESQGLRFGGVKNININTTQPLFKFIDTPTLYYNLQKMLQFAVIAKDKNGKSIAEDLLPNIKPDLNIDQIIPEYKKFIHASVSSMLSRGTNFKRAEFLKDVESSVTKPELIQVLEERLKQIASKAAVTKSSYAAEQLEETLKKEYELIAQAIIDINNIRIYSDFDLSTKTITLNESRYFSNPDDIDKNIIQSFIELQNLANRNIQKRMINDIHGQGTEIKSLRDTFKSLFQSNTKIAAANPFGRDSLIYTKIIGDKAPTYFNIEKFEETVDSKGNVKYKRLMEFRDPEDTSYKPIPGQGELSAEEKQVIKDLVKFLERYRKERGVHSEQNKFQLPLMRSDADSAFRQKFKKEGLVEAAKSYYNEFIDDIKNLDKVAGSDPEYTDRFNRKIEMTDMFQRQDKQEHREQLLTDEEGFEEDLELIIMMYALNHIRKSEYDAVLPAINAGRTFMVVKHSGLMQQYPVIQEYIDMMMRTNIYNKKGLSSEDEETTAKLTSFRNMASNLAIALSPRIGLVNFLTNSWGTISSLYGINSNYITKSDYYKATKFVVNDLPNNLSNINIINYISEEFGVHQMEVSKIIAEAREDKKGIINWGRWFHFLNSAPDFMFRMSLFIAEGLTDGTIKINNNVIDNDQSAIFYDEKMNRIRYDVKKDERFKAYFKGDTSDENYYKQKALYEVVLEDSRKERDAVKDDILMQPYTHLQLAGKFKRADRIYQEMSPENRTWFERTSVGVLVMMFKRWVLSKKNLYWAQAHSDNILGDYEIIEFTDKNGNTKYIAQWKKAPMEGILNSIINYSIEIGNTNSPVQAWENLTDTQRANIGHGVSDMMLFTIITLIGMLGEEKNPRKRKSIEQQLLKIFTNSGRELFILQVALSQLTSNNTVFAVHYTNTLIGELLKSMEHPESLTSLQNKIGILKDVSNIKQGLDISSI